VTNSPASAPDLASAAGTDPAGRATAAAEALAQRTGVAKHDLAIVLGSGWTPAADLLGPAAVDIEMTELPGFLPPAVSGHAGRIRSVPVGGKNVLVFLGRTHLYEGRGVEPVAHGVRTAAAAGARIVVLTNACGGLRPGMRVGEPVLISDHLNLTARSPLVGPRFVDLTDLYAKRLRALVQQIDPSISEGVYAAFPGPHYETPAEIQMVSKLGADLVGMSTALEAIAAHAEGCEVLGLSLVTNLAAGLSGEKLDHLEVLEAGRAAATRMGTLLAQLIELL
jgi:purine-nucleoside phosphorylase